MTTAELRQKYLDFFKSKGHAIIPSASLIPENDPTTLFTGSGMQPMVPFLLGQKHPLGNRIANSQRSFRTGDMDEVGDNRHTTFFEMLGNWSLGDYFKQEQIPWVFEFLTKELSLDPNKIYVTVFRGLPDQGIPKDTEAVEIWKKVFAEAGIEAIDIDFAEKEGMQNGRIFYYDESKNWWSRAGVPKNMPTGEPGGPDSEVFWDFGAELNLHENSEFASKPCHVNCDCGRFLEIGNSVFMQYIKENDGFSPLPQSNVDFGGGLERLTAVTENKQDIFTIDVFKPAIETIERETGKKYSENNEDTKAFRVILDHLRAATFLVADGAIPSNKDQGYFTRRLIRRAVRFAQKLGSQKPFAHEIVSSFIEKYTEAYPHLKEKQAEVVEAIIKEEEKFLQTLSKGLKEFDKFANQKLSGEEAFILFTTYGFPLEMTIELATERGLQIDIEEFNEQFKRHQDLSRTASAGKFKGGLADHSVETTRLHTATHLLLKALRQVLGDHVYQKGSNITKDRLRLDFSHLDKITADQLAKIEGIVNEQITKDLDVSWEEVSLEEAKKRNAMGVFEHKYGEKVKVYTIGDFSCEICGGPHVTKTGELGRFKIAKEEASSAGIRRIKAILES